MAQNVLTPKFRASFVNVFRPGKSMEAEKPGKYSLIMLFAPGADISALKAAAAEAAREKWGDKPPKLLRSPFRDQGEKEFDGYVEGAIFINATSDKRPGVVDQNVQDIIDEEEVYSGCYCRATVRAFAYDVSGNKGVAFGLQNVQKVADGDSLGGGRVKASEEFTAVEGGAKTAANLFD